MRVLLINILIFLCLLIIANGSAGLWLDRHTPKPLRDGTVDPRIESPAYKDKQAATAIFRDFYLINHQYSPYEGLRRAPFTSPTTNVDAEGIRVTPGSPTHPKRLIRFFGGSTMWGTGADDAGTIPGHVQKLLPEARVINHGESGFISAQNLVGLLKLVSLGKEPGTVVFYDGVNDVLVLCDGRNSLDGHAYQTMLTKAIQLYRKEQEGNRDRFWQATVGHIVELARKIQSGNSPQVTQNLAEVPSSRCQDNLEALDQIVEIWWKNWQMAKMITEANGGRFVAVLQPVSSVGKPKRDYLPETKMWDTWYNHAYKLMRQRMASEKAGAYLDLSDAFDSETPYYIDWSHVTPEANAIIANRMLPYISKP